MKLAMSLLVGICLAVPLDAADIPNGEFGHPLGTYLKIEGTRALMPSEKPRVRIKDPHTLDVDTVNGKKLARPIRIRIDNADLGADTRYVLRGYEIGRMTNAIPDEVAKNEPEFAERNGVSQVGWYFFVQFVVTSVAEPAGIKLEKKKTGNDFIIGESAD